MCQHPPCPPSPDAGGGGGTRQRNQEFSAARAPSAPPPAARGPARRRWPVGGVIPLHASESTVPRSCRVGGCAPQHAPGLRGQDASVQRDPHPGLPAVGAGASAWAGEPSLSPTPQVTPRATPAQASDQLPPRGPLPALATKRPLSEDGHLSLRFLPGEAGHQEPLAVHGSLGLGPRAQEPLVSDTPHPVPRWPGGQGSRGPWNLGFPLAPTEPHPGLGEAEVAGPSGARSGWGQGAPCHTS